MRAALFVTEQCDLRCDYCYLHLRPKEMSWETACAAVDFLFGELDGNPPNITFFGGEPLLRHHDLIVPIVDYIAGKNRPVQLYLQTNGTRLTPDILTWLYDRNIGIQLSYHEHHWSRAESPFPGRSVAESFPDTPVTHVISRRNFHRTPDILRFLIAEGFLNIDLSFNYYDRWTTRELDDLAGVYRNVAAIYREEFLRKTELWISCIDVFIRSAVAGAERYHALCDIGATKVAIDADGYIYPCVQFVTKAGPDSEWCLGHVATGFNERRQACISCVRSLQDGLAKEPGEGKRHLKWCGCANWTVTGRIDEPFALTTEHDRRLIGIVDELADDLRRLDKGYFRMYFGDMKFEMKRASRIFEKARRPSIAVV